MALPIQTIVGGNAAAVTGSQPVNLRVGPTGELVVQTIHADGYEAAVRAQLFSGSNSAAVTTSAGFATTHTGLCLSNPIGSGKNLVLMRVKYGGVVAQAAAISLGLQTGYHAATNVVHTTPMVPLSNFVGNPAGVALLDSAATLPIAPTRIILLDTMVTGAITTTMIGGNQYDFNGTLVIPPGGFVATYTSAASTAASLVFGFAWEEVSTTI
jgi:hypothetical protein